MLVIGTSPTGESTVQCLTSIRSDFHGPAGFVDRGTLTVVVNTDSRISSLNSEGTCCEVEFQFNNRFWQWLEVAHPAVYEEIKPEDFASGKESLPGFRRDPAHMLIAIQYVEEFVAQSPDYPIAP